MFPKHTFEVKTKLTFNQIERVETEEILGK